MLLQQQKAFGVQSLISTTRRELHGNHVKMLVFPFLCGLSDWRNSEYQKQDIRSDNKHRLI